MNLLRFMGTLLYVLYEECRFRYYRQAHRFCVETRHPDAPLVARRMVRSQMVVSDFLRGIAK